MFPVIVSIPLSGILFSTGLVKDVDVHDGLELRNDTLTEFDVEINFERSIDGIHAFSSFSKCLISGFLCLLEQVSILKGEYFFSLPSAESLHS